jgi:hypothetical protein
VLVAALAVGLLGMAVWRTLEAALPADDDAETWVKRGSKGAIALFYGGMALLAGGLLVGRGGGGNGDARAKSTTARVLAWPLGRWLVAGAGLVLVGVGVGWAVRGLKRTFEKHLDLRRCPVERRRLVVGVGVVGHTARGVVYLLAGVFLVKAAVQYDAKEAEGLDGTLRRLAGEPYGTALLILVALGLAAFGLFCWASAAYRKLEGA